MKSYISLIGICVLLAAVWSCKLQAYYAQRDEDRREAAVKFALETATEYARGVGERIRESQRQTEKLLRKHQQEMWLLDAGR